MSGAWHLGLVPRQMARKAERFEFEDLDRRVASGRVIRFRVRGTRG